jgi:hypothetical protein
MRRQLADFEITEGAALNIGVIGFDSEQGVIHLPYENTGRVSGIVIHGVIYEGRARNGKAVECHSIRLGRSATTNEIAPGSGHNSADIDLPGWNAAESALLSSSENILFDLSMTYDNGFGHIRTVEFCRTTQWNLLLKQFVWISCQPGAPYELRACAATMAQPAASKK